MEQGSEEYLGVVVFQVQVVPHKGISQGPDVLRHERAFTLPGLAMDDHQFFIIPVEEFVHEPLAFERTRRPGRKKLSRMHGRPSEGYETDIRKGKPMGRL
jgi:hypothetical protein